MTTTVSIQGIGKRYQIGALKAQSRTLRDAVTDAATRPFRRLRHAGSSTGHVSTIWALRDVSLDVHTGEVIGIIGPNGAGKSTLLKILARITEPTEGKAIIQGRVGSLLEVGTGFHQELTGRETTYLMGAILGMSRAEITRKFDGIIDFAEIGEFLDTPVKRYSSGMFVRLAFAVAAHLEPEILLVDEVLAVGDLAFQRKCLGQMERIAGTGRTVFFVSHNMNAIRGLCSRTIEIRGGALVADGATEDVVRQYIVDQTSGDAATGELDCRLGNDQELQITRVRLLDPNGEQGGPFRSSSPITVELEVEIFRLDDAYQLGFDLFADGGLIFRAWQTNPPPDRWPALKLGRNILRCDIPPGLLNEGNYSVQPRAAAYRRHWIVKTDDALWFEVIKDHSDSPFFWIRHDGPIAPVLEWRAVSGEVDLIIPPLSGAEEPMPAPTPPMAPSVGDRRESSGKRA
jgi:lipopolysaccharide transport system ATP-binding protein